MSSSQPFPFAIQLDISAELLADQTVAWAVDFLGKACRKAGMRLTAEPGPADAVTLNLAIDPGLGHEDYCQTRTGPRLEICSGGARGLSYALTEMAAAVDAGEADILAGAGGVHRPAVPLRGIARAFSSIDEDAPWFHDRQFWNNYLDMLACQRFNRFHLALGMQFNYGTIDRGLIDNYFAFPYPFLLDVPRYTVRVDGLDPAERAANLEAIRHIARETRRRGMQFSLGLWTHAYAFPPATRHRFPILGISDSIHAQYCAAGLSQLLAEVPEIDALTFRVHFEAGIREATQEVFWGELFAAIAAAGRPIEVDLHAKGVGEPLLEAARANGLRVSLSGKYWAEHLGLPYHQTTIRERETALPVPEGETMSALASYSRLFTRYGYADYLEEDGETAFFFRMWPGTQKLLLWGDPALAAGYGRYSTFGGAKGVEFCEPLFFKGRKNGRADGRDPYLRDELRLGREDWLKYRYTYLLWGRLLYDPETPAAVWRRQLRADYSVGAMDVETGLGALSRILPLISVVHGVGGANNIYWPELYVDLPVSAWLHSDHYDKNYEWDNSAPQNWGRVSAFDPAMFYGINDYAADLLADALGPRHTPLEVAGWIDAMVAEGERAIGALSRIGAGDPAQLSRTVIDMQVLASLGRFFASKFRAATDYALFERTGARSAIAAACDHLQQARDAYAAILPVVDGVYQSDLVFGTELSEHGHWAQRITAIDAELRVLALERQRAPGGDEAAYIAAKARHRRERHVPQGIRHDPAPFMRDAAHPIRLVAPASVTAATLFYRPVDQSQAFENCSMTAVDGGFEATIPSACTATGYPVMYYFVLELDAGLPIIWPGFAASLDNQPYFDITSVEKQKGRR